jgi:tRNA(fMet)-specific endonuclease VapC
MEAPSLGVILDARIIIEAERQHLDVAKFLKQIVERIGEMEAALSCITVAELAHGIHRADSSERRERRRAFLNDVKAAVPVYPITDSTAEMVGKIGDEAATTGVNIPLDDLLIGRARYPRPAPDLDLTQDPTSSSRFQVH